MAALSTARIPARLHVPPTAVQLLPQSMVPHVNIQSLVDVCVAVQAGSHDGGDGGGGDDTPVDTPFDTTELTDKTFDLSVVPPLLQVPTAYTSYSYPPTRGIVTGRFFKLAALYAAVEEDAPVPLFTVLNVTDTTEQASFPPRLFTEMSMAPDVTILWP